MGVAQDEQGLVVQACSNLLVKLSRHALIYWMKLSRHALIYWLKLSGLVDKRISGFGCASMLTIQLKDLRK